jgi:molybdopterin-guanine dinucleotide biosynthesis protein A
MPYPETLGVILAGGLARRMGGSDKPLLKLGGRTLLSIVEKRLSEQCAGVILSANGDLSRFSGINLPVFQDTISGHQGPLAGVLTALEWAAIHRPSVAWVVSVPGDTPFIPNNLVQRLHTARASSHMRLACAASGSHEHYTTCLWPVDLRHDLRHALIVEGTRRTGEWVKAHGLGTVSWPTEPFDPFFNINTPEELDVARAMMMGHFADLDGLSGSSPATREKRDG